MVNESHPSVPSAERSRAALAQLAHELSNPCAACRLSAETALALMEAGAPADQLRACLENIIAAMSHFDQIVLALRQMSRQQGGLADWSNH